MPLFANNCVTVKGEWFVVVTQLDLNLRKLTLPGQIVRVIYTFSCEQLVWTGAIVARSAKCEHCSLGLLMTSFVVIAFALRWWLRGRTRKTWSAWTLAPFIGFDDFLRRSRFNFCSLTPIDASFATRLSFAAMDEQLSWGLFCRGCSERWKG